MSYSVRLDVKSQCCILTTSIVNEWNEVSGTFTDVIYTNCKIIVTDITASTFRFFIHRICKTGICTAESRNILHFLVSTKSTVGQLVRHRLDFNITITERNHWPWIYCRGLSVVLGQSMQLISIRTAK